MCGRYSLTTPGDILAQAFDVLVPEVSWSARYNIAPGTNVPVVRGGDSSERVLDSIFWGLLPRWRKKATDPRLINARSETAAEKPSFRAAFRENRCLFPADGFYEWKKVPGGKSPQLMRRPDRAPFAMAGIFELGRKEDPERKPSGSILTTAANQTLAEIHDRMPVVLAPDQWGPWLDSDTPLDVLMSLCRPASEDYFEVTSVSSRVNNPRNDDELCLEPAGSLRGAESGTQGGLF